MVRRRERRDREPSWGAQRWRGVTLAAAALAMLFLGAIYAYGVVLPILMETFGWTRSQAALPQSVLLFVYAVGMFLGGALQDRWAPRVIALGGGVLFGTGILLTALVTSLWTLILAYGVLGGLGCGMMYVAAVTAAMRAFPRRRGFAAGVTVGAFGLGLFLWAPLAQAAIPQLGWTATLRWFGALALVALPIIGSQIRVAWHPHEIPGEHPRAAGLPAAQALRAPAFWITFTAYTLAMTAGLMSLAHQVNLAQERGLLPAAAALTLSLTSVGSATGRLVMGWLSDRLGRFPCLIGASALGGGILAGFAWASAPVAFGVLAVCFGLAFGTWLALYGPTATDLFGLRDAGTIYGALYMSYGLGGLLGPTLGGLLADLGGYRLAYLAGAGVAWLSLAAFLLAGRRRHHAGTPAPGEEFPV